MRLALAGLRQFRHVPAKKLRDEPVFLASQNASLRILDDESRP
jgi:hypothetical protein